MKTRTLLAIEQFQITRRYTVGLLDNTGVEDWFRFPVGGMTHIGWQVGHLAVSEYRCILERVRGTRLEDAALLLSQEYLQLFSRRTTADPNPERYPAPEELRSVLENVHKAALNEMARISDVEWDDPILASHPRFQTKGEMLLWVSLHEMIHAGQIGLLRRLLGYEAMW